MAKLLTVRNARRPRADTALKPTHEYMVMLRQHIAATYLSRKKKARVPERPLSLMTNMLVLECLESGNPELGQRNYETPT